ncbi:MAG: HisA/HisF-related TIM barrel protein, partial [Rikenellaceae bacterium]
LFKLFTPHGLKHIITTDISRDGMMCGAATELYKSLNSEFPELNIIASGGISRMADIEELDAAGVGSVIVGKALYEGGITFKELRECLQRG